MFIDILKALLLGFCVAVPIGPVLLLVMQKTLSRGRWFGVAAGCGSAVIDTAYACIGLFALSLIEDFIIGYEDLLFVIGGVLLGVIGMWMALRREDRVVERQDRGSSAFAYGLQAAGCALSNPGSLVFMLALITFFGVSVEEEHIPVWSVIVCVFAGEVSYWLGLTYALVHFKKFSRRTVRKISHIAGLCIVAFGLVLIVKGSCL